MLQASGSYHHHCKQIDPDSVSFSKMAFHIPFWRVGSTEDWRVAVGLEIGEWWWCLMMVGGSGIGGWCWGLEHEMGLKDRWK